MKQYLQPLCLVWLGHRKGQRVELRTFDGATVEFFQLHKVPLSRVNKTHTSIGNIDLRLATP